MGAFLIFNNNDTSFGLFLLISSKSITFFLKSLEYGTGIVFARILFSWRKKCKLNLVGYNTNSDSGVIEPMIYTDDRGNIVRWRMNANLDKVSPADPKDKEAGEVIVKVAEVLESLKEEVVLQYGDFLRIDNVTGASAF